MKKKINNSNENPILNALLIRLSKIREDAADSESDEEEGDDKHKTNSSAQDW